MHKAPTSRRDRRGFALLITITMLAFLVLLLVSLSSLTRVETQIAGNSQSLSKARQNALLALNVAIGELQRNAGPDQRITATADLLANTDPSKIRWTGVWDSTSPTSSPTWLVSRADPAVAPSNTGAAPAPDQDNIQLVGANSTDISTVAGNRVVVPAQKITADVPGIGTNTTVGKFAWWVGDEGVKARVNLQDPWAGATAAQRINSWTTGQRAGIEQVRNDAGVALGGAYPANTPATKSILGLQQLTLLGSSTSTTASLNEVARQRFYDLSAYSRGVLSDTAKGGLKKDLTAWLRNPAPVTGDSANQKGVPADTDLIFTPQDMGAGTGTSDSFGLPTWGLIRDFNNTRYDGTTPVTPRIATDTTQGINPVLTLARLGFALTAVKGSSLTLHLFPTAVLWNPYSVPLAPGLYEFGFMQRPDGTASFCGFNFRVNTPTGDVSLAWLGLNRASFSTTSGSPSNNDRYFAFRIRVTEPIPAGQSWVFSLPADGGLYTGQNELVHGNNPQLSVVMVPGDPANPVPATATTITWKWTPTAGTTFGPVDVSLRPAYDSPPSGWPAFQGRDLRTSAFETIQRMGNGGSTMPFPDASHGQPVLDVSPPLGPTQPDFALVMTASMGHAYTGGGRWIATNNYRSQLSLRILAGSGTTLENPNPTNFLIFGSTPSSGGQDPLSPTYVTFDGDRASSAINAYDVPASDVVLAEILPTDAPLASLAQLQHANLARISIYPGNAVGNSFANYRIPGEAIQRALTQASSSEPLTSQVSCLYDFSYGLNRALWDRYFFSTIPDGLTIDQIRQSTYNLPNSRLRFFRPGAISTADDLLKAPGFDYAATQLLVEGAFNVNSTSVDAWRALLASANGLAYDPQTRSSGPALVNPISRFSVPSGNSTDIWAGYRSLTDAQLDQLAKDIVAQVKARGPFRSLADFINRRLLPKGDPKYAQAVEGTLQAALDTTTTGSGAVNAANVPPFDDTTTTVPRTTNVPSYIQADLIRGNTSTTNIAPYSSLMAFAPGMVSQADLLNAIGPVISARSDTFRVRTYGEVINPATGATEGKAYCEAIVQRMPDYVDTVANPNPADAATGTNVTFGRRFTVVSFRWLTPNDL